jgi:hypothetical protein
MKDATCINCGAAELLNRLEAAERERDELRVGLLKHQSLTAAGQNTVNVMLARERKTGKQRARARVERRVMPPCHQNRLLTKEQAMNLKYRKKPVVIEAFQMTEERRASNADWPEWMHRAWQLDREAPGSLYPTEEGTGDGTLSIGTLEGQHLVSWGDWIIKGVKGELYPCKPDIFEATYEAA